MKKAAIVYDFDKTLCAKDMQEYSLIPDLGYQNPASFWKEVSELSRAQRMDSISAYLYLLKKRFEEQGKPLSRESFILPSSACRQGSFGITLKSPPSSMG